MTAAICFERLKLFCNDVFNMQGLNTNIEGISMLLTSSELVEYEFSNLLFSRNVDHIYDMKMNVSSVSEHLICLKKRYTITTVNVFQPPPPPPFPSIQLK